MPCIALLAAAATIRLVPAMGEGLLDPAFGAGGVAITGVPGQARALVRDAAGALYLGGVAFGGTDFDLAVVKLAADGSPDDRYGEGGLARIDGGSHATDAGYALVVDGAGAAFIAGVTGDGAATDMVVAKLDADGRPVASFGEGGVARVDLGGSADECLAMTLAGDGGLYLAGQRRASNLRGFALARLDASGNPVAAFGSNGVALIDFDGHDATAYALLDVGDGHLVVAGTIDYDAQDTDMVLVEIDTAGALVPSFGDGGRAVVHVDGLSTQAAALARDSLGNLYVAGSAGPPGGLSSFFLAKFDSSGHAATWGEGGHEVVAPVPDQMSFASAVTLGANGEIYLAGSSSTHNEDFIAVALHADGSVRPDFGTDGTGVIDLDLSTGYDYAYAASLDPHGAFYVAGSANGLAEASFAVVKLDIDGIDPIFHSGFDEP